MNFSKLRGKIREVYGTEAAFSLAMGINAASLSAKLNNSSPWKREELEKACDLLGIPIEKVHVYFF